MTLKKYTTLAGTLVFFLIMSIVPLTFWITLVLGKLPIDTERILSLPVFASVKEVLLYVQKEATNATSSTSLLLIVTTLYSSTNLFYQMRKSGELIYDYRRKQTGIWLRLGALALLLVVMTTIVIFIITFGVGTLLFSRFLSGVWELIADYALLIGLAFSIVLLLNAYICPYKTKISCFLPGTLITLTAWGLAIAVFSVYLKISNMSKLYGALTVIIVFLLWLYVLMICFIVGVILNSENVIKQREKNSL